MKHTFLVLFLATSVSTLFARVLTVSNHPGTIAQFNTIQAAITAANAIGFDTIYVHGSPVIYAGFILSKRAAIVGPGWRPDTEKALRALVGSSIVGEGGSFSRIEGLVFL